MSVFEVRIDDDARVMLTGELDMATAPRLRTAIESLVTADPLRVVIDLAGVSFMDSSGVAALCEAQAKLEAGGGVLVLGPRSRQVQSVLQMVGLESAFVEERPGA